MWISISSGFPAASTASVSARGRSANRSQLENQGVLAGPPEAGRHGLKAESGGSRAGDAFVVALQMGQKPSLQILGFTHVEALVLVPHRVDAGCARNVLEHSLAIPRMV